jgi:hypothetical protein
VNAPPRERPAWSAIIIAGASLFVAAMALWVAIAQTEAMREQNRLSVRPQLDWRIVEDRSGHLTVALINVDLGPAIVRNVRLVHDSRELGLAGQDACNHLSVALHRADIEAWDQTCFTVGDSAEAEIYLNDDDRLVLYEVEPRPGVDWLPAGAGEHITIRATYCSLYEQCFSLEEAQ